MSNLRFADPLPARNVSALPAWCAVEVLHVGPAGTTARTSSAVVEETPVALRYGGFAHAVMMATPDDLADFALGFSLTEGIIRFPSDIARMEFAESPDGITIDMTLEPSRMHRFLAGRRVRRLRGHTSCGICGAEDLHDVQRPFLRVAPGSRVSATQVQAALSALRSFQPLSRLTRGAHASAWVGLDGAIRAVREDVGRHNALDKLIGAGLAGAFSSAEGFCLITSRCSFEMVQKAVAAGYGTLVAAAAPTALAIRTAAAAGLTLFSLARGDGHMLYTAPAMPKEAPHECETQDRAI